MVTVVDDRADRCCPRATALISKDMRVQSTFRADEPWIGSVLDLATKLHSRQAQEDCSLTLCVDVVVQAGRPVKILLVNITCILCSSTNCRN